MCPRSTRETNGIATILLGCGIASEALRRNIPLREAASVSKCVRPLIVGPSFCWGVHAVCRPHCKVGCLYGMELRQPLMHVVVERDLDLAEDKEAKDDSGKKR